jgi:tRNA(Ser,Leu) C12 N-acetylase TAN1
MRTIKTFKMFESSYAKAEAIQKRIKEVLDAHYTPNAVSEKDTIKYKNYLVSAYTTETKFGKNINIILNFPEYEKIRYSELNIDFKQLTIVEEIKDIISEFEQGDISFIGFDFMEKSARGKKNGHTKTIEEVNDKFNQALDELDQEPDNIKNGAIFFLFIVK